MPAPLPLRWIPLVALLMASFDSYGADVDVSTRKRIDECVHRFWKSFVLEDVAAMEAVADAVVVGDIKKGLWLRDRLGKVQQVKSEKPILSEKDVPGIEIVSVKEGRIMSMAGVLMEVDTYEVSFTAKEMSGTMHLSKEDPTKVVAFTDN